MINFLRHPVLRDTSHKDYKKSGIYTWAVLVIAIFLLPYCIYFYIEYPEDTTKNLTNLVFGGFFMLGLVINRYSSNILYPTYFVSSIAYPPIMISVYNTGGIYSVDIIWFLVCIISQCILIDYKVGIAASLLVIGYLVYLYIIESTLTLKDNVFKNYLATHNSTHSFFTLIFVIVLIVALLSTFAKALDAANAKLEQLSKQKIDNLETALLDKTKELSLIRQTLAKDFHDEMGNKLASISLLSQSIGLKLRNDTSPEDINHLLSTIETRSKELYQGTKDFIWSIDLKSDYTDELFIYVRDFGEVFFEPLNISFYSSHEQQTILTARLPATTGRQLVYIIKEIMTNAAKHSDCSEITLKMKSNDNDLEIGLADNGKGFDYTASTKRGLRNIEQRIAFVNGKMEVNCTKGTCYKLTIPLEKSSLSILESTKALMI